MSVRQQSGYKFRWSIENFSFCDHNEDEMLVSPYFVAGEGIKWELILFPRGESDDELKNIVCYLCLKDVKSCSSPYIDCKLEIIGASGKVLECEQINENIIYYKTPISIETKVVMQDIEETNRDVLIICCDIYKQRKLLCEPFEREVHTKIQIDRLIFKLNVPWLDKRIEPREIISFPSNAQFTLDIIQFVDKLKGDKYIKFQIWRSLSVRSLSHFVNFKLSLLEANGNKGKSWINNYFFRMNWNNDIWDVPMFLPITEIQSDVSKYVRDGNLLFLCDFSCSGGIISEGEEEAHYLSDKKFPTLQEDLQFMLKSKKHCDVKLKVADDIIEAHKSILASRSPVFSSMFDQDMLETQTGIVSIPDVDACTLNSFLNFLYTDTVAKLNYESATNLIIFSDKYQVISLKEKCATYLKSELSVENACEVAALADMVCHSELKSITLNFIAANSKIILTKPEWLPWMKNNMELATEIFSRLTESVTLS